MSATNHQAPHGLLNLLGVVCQVHGETKHGTGGSGDRACTNEVFNVTLAGFLIGAGERAFYACTDGWTAQAGWSVLAPAESV